MSKSVSFSETSQELTENAELTSSLEDNETSDAIQGRQFNKFSLLETADGDASVGSSNSDTDQKSEDQSDMEQIRSDSKLKQSLRESARVTNISKQKSRRKRGKKGSKSKNKDLEDLENEVNNLTKAIVLHSSANHKLNEDAKYKLLKVDMRNLIPEAEIKRMFGKSVFKDDKAMKQRQGSGPNFQRSRFVASSYFQTKTPGRSSVIKMELDQEVNDNRRRDLSHTTGNSSQKCDKTNLEAAASLTSDGPIYFKFVHDRAYQEAHRVFLREVDRGNAQSILQNLTISPFHIESFLQLSLMILASEDYKTASEFVERAILLFEKAFHPRFNVATANCRLTYKRPENRTFFITIFKHILYCHRRGLRRTPFEYSKLLLSLEPENDPLQAVQLIDFYALRSEEYDYLIEFYNKWDRLQKMPNFTYSVALAHFLKSRSSKLGREESLKNLGWADEFLQKALIVFPNFINPLLDACSGEPNDELKKCSYFDYSVFGANYKLVPETVDALTSLYVKRTFSIWKQKPVMCWLEKNVETMVNKFKNGELNDERRQIEHWQAFPKVAPKNILRHIALCGLDVKIPPSASSSTYVEIDPYPPTDPIVSYDSSWQTNNQESSGESGSLIGNLGGLFLRSFLPSFNLSDEQQDSGRPINSTSESPSQQGSRRHQDVNHTSQGNFSGQGSQITMEDYIIDDDEAGELDQNRLFGDQIDMQSIRHLASTVTNLLNMQPSVHSNLEQRRDAANRQDNPSGRNDDNPRGDDGRRSQ